MTTDTVNNPWPLTDLRIDLDAKLAQLNSDTADMVVLWVEGYSHSAIGLIFGLHQSSVSRRLVQAALRIRAS